MKLIVNRFDDEAIQVLSNEGAQCGDCGDEPGNRCCPVCEKFRAGYVAALRAAGWAPHGEVQQQINRVSAELAAIKERLAELTAAAER